MTFQENRVENILTLKIGQLTRQNVFQCDLIFVTIAIIFSFNLNWFCLTGV